MPALDGSSAQCCRILLPEQASLGLTRPRCGPGVAHENTSPARASIRSGERSEWRLRYGLPSQLLPELVRETELGPCRSLDTESPLQALPAMPPTSDWSDGPGVPCLTLREPAARWPREPGHGLPRPWLTELPLVNRSPAPSPP
jgi:hypothetical protein